jgi:Na+/proline symporter
MSTITTRRAGAAAIAAVAAIHLLLAPEYLDEKVYVGVLFVVGAIAGGLVALRLWQRSDHQAWLLGSLIAVGMGAGFILSRTVGLPGFHESEWELSGIVSLLFEAGFVALAGLAVRNGRESLFRSRAMA